MNYLTINKSSHVQRGPGNLSHDYAERPSKFTYKRGSERAGPPASSSLLSRPRDSKSSGQWAVGEYLIDTHGMNSPNNASEEKMEVPVGSPDEQSPDFTFDN